MRIKHDKGILIGDSDARYIFGNETKVKQVKSDEHNKNLLKAQLTSKVQETRHDYDSQF